MKKLMQKLVKATLCIGVVSVSLIACESDPVPNDQNIIDLDQLDNLIMEVDTSLIDSLGLDDETIEEPVVEKIETEFEKE